MYGKKLAYGVKIKEIREIPGADRIELATVMDYTVVVKNRQRHNPGSNYSNGQRCSIYKSADC